MPGGEIDILTKWVKMGAPWPKVSTSTISRKKPFPLKERRSAHWSWQPVSNCDPPSVKDGKWPLRSVDAFILNRLEEGGFVPAPPADRRTLLRRVYFDLIGLPPTPEQVASFVNDPSPLSEAFRKVVERLLESRHFGERWARHWLDVVRYAESRGHEFDHSAPNAHEYRDYVIRALNADLPYDQFVVEQIAGDLLETPRLHTTEGFNESVLGTAFWYLGDWVHSPTDIRQDETDRIDNMINVFGRSFLGLTIGCARCHDHKFDAISTKDYYALAGFAQSSLYRQVRFDTLEHNRKIAELLRDLRRDFDANGASFFRRCNQAHRRSTRGLVAENARPKRGLFFNNFAITRRLGKRPCTGGLYEGDAARMVTRWFCVWRWPRAAGALRLTDDPDAPIAGCYTYGAACRDQLWAGLKVAPGTELDAGVLGTIQRSGQTLCTPTFEIRSGVVNYLIKGAAKVQAVVDSHRLIAGPLHGALIKSAKTGKEPQWVSHRLERYVGHRAHLEFVPDGDGELEVLMVAESPSPPPAWTEFVLEDYSPPSSAEGDSEQSSQASRRQSFGAVCEKLLGAETTWEPHEAAIADWMMRHRHRFLSPQDESERRLTEFAKSYLMRRAELAAGIQKTSRTAIAVFDGPSEDERLLIRGQSNNPGGLVSRRFLEAIQGSQAPAYTSRSGRLELARQMVDAETNPFISRVIVNRVWHHLFGQGLVTSPDNFGVLGRPPSHPKLLDHMASRFVADGWSIKNLIRELVTSRTYQMSSQTSDQRAEDKDPNNVLLHRMSVRRLEGEIVRDSILAVSGRLDRTIEGRPVPVHLTSFMTGRGRPASGPLDGGGRRSIYTSVRRNFLSPMMLAFDVPIPAQPVGRRNVSNVPAQALILMNDPFVKEQAEAWAQRVLSDADSTAKQRITNMYEQAFARPPSEHELADALEFLHLQSTVLGLTSRTGKRIQRYGPIWPMFYGTSKNSSSSTRFARCTLASNRSNDRKLDVTCCPMLRTVLVP